MNKWFEWVIDRTKADHKTGRYTVIVSCLNEEAATTLIKTLKLIEIKATQLEAREAMEITPPTNGKPVNRSAPTPEMPL